MATRMRTSQRCCFIRSALEIVDAGDRNSLTGLGSAFAVPAPTKNNNIEDKNMILFLASSQPPYDKYYKTSDYWDEIYPQEVASSSTVERYSTH